MEEACIKESVEAIHKTISEQFISFSLNLRDFLHSTKTVTTK